MNTVALPHPPCHSALVPMTPTLAAQMSVEMARVWGLIHIGLQDPISLRAIPPAFLHAPVQNRTFTTRDHPDVAARKRAFEDAAIALNMQGYNCYIIMNRIREVFGGPKAVADRDILIRTLLLIDIDRAGKADCPATVAELRDCMLIAKAVRTFLVGNGFPASCGAFSGNGFHLYYRLDGLPNHRFTRDQIKAMLKGLAARFNTDKARIDTVVHNASRITKLPGTIAYKGIASLGVNDTVKIPTIGKVKFPTFAVASFQVVWFMAPPFLGGRPRRLGTSGAGGERFAVERTCSGRRSAWRRRR